MSNKWYCGVLVLLVLWISACSDKEELPLEDTRQKSITLLTSVGGNGDNGYNDLILSGAYNFYKENEVRFSLLHPTDLTEAQQQLDTWVKQTADGPSDAILLMASNDYKSLLTRSITLSAHQRIVVFECTHDGLPERVSSFRIGRYGAAYLAGCLARESGEAHIVAAMANDDLLKDAIDGFVDGYQQAGGKKAVTHYLATDAQGYSVPNEAYRLLQSLNEESFVFPLAGGSNSGIYKFSRENPFLLLLISGMDVDCSEYSTRIPFSLVIGIDQIVQSLLQEWYVDGELPAHKDYTLSSENAIDLLINQTFWDRIWVWQDYYEDASYWKNGYEHYKDEAINKEKAYYAR